ncbi:MAG TPA: recombinase family protein [Acidimicrobiales bacterium]|nr:recombinase family protein [Acidimicrobiales bacterium]
MIDASLEPRDAKRVGSEFTRGRRQTKEGFSIEGQADKLRAYSTLRDLGEVTILTDPGRSGKYMLRPGLQQLLAAVEAGHVRHVLVWRLDRLSRNLGDLILLADKFGESGVSLNSVSENLDLSSAAGRMFYNVLGSFAQYFREQLSENVRMGNERAIKEGRWINRPKTGYDLVDGLLVPNVDARRAREIFQLRAERHSYRSIEERTGIKYSTICTILTSRIYLGEDLLNHQWFKGLHEPLVPRNSSTRPSARSPRACSHRATRSRERSSVDSVASAWRSSRMARGRSTTPVGTEAKDVRNPCAAREDWLVACCSGLTLWVTTKNSRGPSGGGCPVGTGRCGAPDGPAGRRPGDSGDTRGPTTQTPATLLRRSDQRRRFPRRGVTTRGVDRDGPDAGRRGD